MIMIKHIHYTFVVSAAIWLANTPSSAQLAKDEALYLNHSFSVPSPGLALEDDAIIRFELDVTGDGKPEHFFSKESLRDGKMGHIWSVYSVDATGEMRLVGEETFRHDALAPSAWNNHQGSFGFYSYFPGGGGKGLLSFFMVDGNLIRRMEKREIEPTGADKTEFDGLFAPRLNGESPKIELKRTAMTKQQSATTSSGMVNAPPASRENTPTPKPPSVVQLPAPKKAPEAKPPSENPTSSTTWSVILILAASGLLWLLLKKRK